MVVPTNPSAEGTPTWADLGVTDLPRSQTFHSGPLGWPFDEPMSPQPQRQG